MQIKEIGKLPSDHADNGFYGQDIISVSQFNRGNLDYIWRGARDAGAGGTLWQRGSVAGQNPGEPVLRTEHAHQFQLHGSHAALGGQGDPD